MDKTGQLIVVVEDDDSLRQALQRVLAAGGYRTRVFSSAEAMLANGAGAGALCLVLDIHLPGTSGLALYEGLGASRPPVVFMSADESTSYRVVGARLGAAAFLSKPFLGSVLLGAVAQATASPRRSPPPSTPA